jgi:hypothetical protein
MTLDYGEYSTVTSYQQDGDGSNPLSYEQHLDGDWALFYKVARYFIHKVKFEDRQDFLHDLMLEMAKVKAKYKAKGKPLTEAGLMRVASYEVTEYWHILMRHRPTMLSLNSKADGDGSDENGEPSEIMEFLADDKAIDLVARLDARRCLQGMPRRLVQIGYKLYAGYKLDRQEQNYLKHYRNRYLKQQQKVLF